MKRATIKALLNYLSQRIKFISIFRYVARLFKSIKIIIWCFAIKMKYFLDISNGSWNKCDSLHDLVLFVKNVKNTHWRVLLLETLQVSPCNFTKSDTPPWVYFCSYLVQLDCFGIGLGFFSNRPHVKVDTIPLGLTRPIPSGLQLPVL